MPPTMRTSEVEEMRSQLLVEVRHLLLRYVIPAFAVLAIGMGAALWMIAHAANVDKYDRCSDGVDGRAVTRALFHAIAEAARSDLGANETADFIDRVVDTQRPPEDKLEVCGPEPDWWDI
jgi:hypothetical protein